MQQQTPGARVSPTAPGQAAPEIDPFAGEYGEMSEEERKRELFLQRLDDLGQSLSKTRAEAINARKASGIEEIWFEDEEFYEGIDDANRGESHGTWRTKPAGEAAQEGPKSTRSTVVPNITGPYVDAAAARIADMLLPTDDRAWALLPTPIPDAIDTSEGKYPKRVLLEAAAKHPGDPTAAKHSLALATEAALELISEAKAKADKAQTRIEDWHVESQWHAQVRTVIEDSARIGTGILKGPVPMKKTRMSYKEGKIVREGKSKPGSKWVDAWNFFPDPACGENIHNGAYTWERDYLTRKQLRELLKQDGYIQEQIERCLTEGPMLATGEYKETPDPVVDPQQKDKFEVWYYHGTAEREDLEAMGVDCTDVVDPHAPALITMVNNRVIKSTLNPLDSGEYPYDVMVWRRRSGHWTGIGVARQIRTPQRIVTAATRNLMDNAGLAAGPMLVFRQAVISPADGKYGIAPRKLWYIAEDAEGMEDATKAMGLIEVDMMVDELMKIIELGLKLAEDVTGLPMLLQGQMGQETPDTLGQTQILNNNASAVLRRLARLFDDRITEPHVRRYYTWLLEHGEEEEKGDYCIDARGSSALVERDLQNQAIAQMGSIVVDLRFGLDPKKWAQEFLKSQRLDVRRFEFDDEEWKAILENMSKEPADMSMQVAQIRAKSAEAVKQLDGQIKQKLLMLEQRFVDHQDERNRQLEMWLADLDREGKQSISLTALKGMLAKTVMTIKGQERISARTNVARSIGKPPTEPPGRAQKGRAFEH